MSELCNAIKKNGEKCASFGNIFCEDCAGTFCKWHAGRIHGKNKCPDIMKYASGY